MSMGSLFGQLRALAFVVVLGLGLPGVAAPSPKPQGALVIGGGAIREDNAEVWQRIVSLAGGPHAKIAIIAAASGDPEASARRSIEIFKRYGAEAFFVPVAPLLKGSNVQKAAVDPANVKSVLDASGVFFTGGEQARITRALLTADGGRSPLLNAVFDVYERGGVVAGSSAGAAIMSTTMFYEPDEVIDTLLDQLKPGKDFAAGLGFIGPDYFVDQHFIVRGRFARMLPLMVATGYRYGFGVDENTAIVVQPTKNTIEVIGKSGVILVDLSAAKAVANASQTARPAFGVTDARLSYLAAGDVFDMATKAVQVSPHRRDGLKLDWQSPSFKPTFSTPQFYTDMLGRSILTDALVGLVNNQQTEARGIALGAPKGQHADLGVEFRFYKDRDTVGFADTASGDDDYTILNMHLDVRPIVPAQPLYRYR